MHGIKKAVAILLPALSASLVLPSDHAVKAVESVSEGPASRIPFVFEYSVSHEASIQFALQTESRHLAPEEPDAEIITVVVPASEAQGCSEDFNTQIQVNGAKLVASLQETVDGQVVQRSGISQLDLAGPGPATAKAWSLQCACFDDITSLLSAPFRTCHTVGYILNVQLASTAKGVSEGFTLSFIQAPQPKLLRISALAVSVLDSARASAEVLRNSQHWASPLLRPIDAIFGQVPTSTLSQILPVFSSTSALAFRTITTPVSSIAASPSTERYLAELASPTLLIQHDELAEDDKLLGSVASSQTSLYALPQETGSSTVDSVPQAEAASDGDDSETCCSVKAFKEIFRYAGIRAQKTLQSVVDHLAQAHADVVITHPALAGDHSRNETREFHEEATFELKYDGDFSHTHAALGLTFVIFTISSSLIFVWLRRRDPRRRAELAARREERVNRRLYKNAATKHKFKSWFDRLRGRETYQPQSQIYSRAQVHSRRFSRELDPEWVDKEATLIEPSEQPSSNPAPTHHINKELGDFREAHGFVEGILRATSGMYRGPRNYKRAASRSSRHTRRYSDAASDNSTLPPYTSEDENEYDDIVVIDGLHFTLRRRREGPKSSVIDTSPRESVCGSSDSEKE